MLPEFDTVPHAVLLLLLTPSRTCATIAQCQCTGDLSASDCSKWKLQTGNIPEEGWLGVRKAFDFLRKLSILTIHLDFHEGWFENGLVIITLPVILASICTLPMPWPLDCHDPQGGFPCYLARFQVGSAEVAKFEKANSSPPLLHRGLTHGVTVMGDWPDQCQMLMHGICQ